MALSVLYRAIRIYRASAVCENVVIIKKLLFIWSEFIGTSMDLQIVAITLRELFYIQWH